MVDSSAVAHAAISIASFLVKEGKYLYGAENKVRSLQNDLIYMHQLLADVDASPHLTRQDTHLRHFTQEIQDLAIRAEDAIDTFIVTVDGKIDRKNPIVEFVGIAYHSRCIHVLRNEIEAIQLEIQRARERYTTFPVITSGTSSPRFQRNNNSFTIRPGAEHYIHLDDQVVVGIDDDIIQLVHRLTDPADQFKVLAILGTGGAGKTTLASKLYRHPKVSAWFSHKAFVSVSQEWSRIGLLHCIFKEVKKDGDIPDSESALVDELREFLKDKQCLVVLDDIWKKEAWDDIYPILPTTTRGCRIILTTRIEEVHLHADSNCVIHIPKLLTDDQKWALFSKGAIEGRECIENNIDEFTRLGKKILEKCVGLPLAVVTLAGILRTKTELYQWEEIKYAYPEYILQGRGAPNYGVVEDMLELSYIDLPSYLKPCFLYLAIFPEDYSFPVQELIQMLIAEGFIVPNVHIGHGKIEDVAMRFIHELAQRCILQVTRRSARGQIQKFRIHDLIRELCIKKARECQFVATDFSTSLEVGRRSQPRRIAISTREYIPAENPHLRTLVYFGTTRMFPRDGSILRLESIPEMFKLLRILKLRGIGNVVLPWSFGNLVHLTHLSIKQTSICELPKSTKNLRNLLYIEYTRVLDPTTGGAGAPAKVPSHLAHHMESLIGLVLPQSLLRRGHTGIKKNRSFELSGSKNLKRLVSGAGAWMARELPTLSATVENLTIECIEHEEEMTAIYECPSVMEDRLCVLSLSCSVLAMENGVEFELQKLSKCRRLWCLILGCQLANVWKGTIQFPPNLVELQLSKTSIVDRDDFMQVLGELSKLKSLTLCDNIYGTRFWCVGNVFPELQELELDRMFDLEEWRMEEGAMARLSKLKIRSCPKLKRLPESIKYITSLKRLKITYMPIEFCKRLKQEGEDFCIIQNIDLVIFKDGYAS